jgi:hypothetical protein
VPDPKPLAGAPLGAATGLRLLVADTAPFVLDVDTGRSSPVAGIPSQPGVLWVVGVGGRGAVVVQGSSTKASLYGVRGAGSRAARLGIGSQAWPAVDGRSAWVQVVGDRGRCMLRRVTLDGRVVRSARPFPCATHSDPAGGTLGLVVNRTRIVDPRSGRTVRRTRRGIVAVAGRTLVLAGPGERLTLLDAETGAERRLPRFESLRGPGRAAVDPSGRFAVIEYAEPAWRGTQVFDLWLVNARTGALTRLPGMPAVISLKFTDMAWTDDGRFVLLGEDDRGGFVAVWRPGEERLAVKRVRLPQRTSGSDSFAILR